MIKIPPVSMLDWLIVIVVAGVSFLILIAALKRIWRGPLKPPYQQKLLFSREAIQGLRLIDEAVGSQLRVFANVSLAEFMMLNPQLKKSQREQALHQLYGETVDFILCSPQDLKIRVVIVLSDDSMRKKDQRKQQQLWQALQAAGLPMVEISPKALPSVGTLRADILTACKTPAPANSPLTNKAGASRVEPVISVIDDTIELEQDDNEPVMKISAND